MAHGCSGIPASSHPNGVAREREVSYGGPGRPTRSVEADYLVILGDAVTRDRWRKIVERAISADR